MSEGERKEKKDRKEDRVENSTKTPEAQCTGTQDPVQLLGPVERYREDPKNCRED